jgi:hypothetical protein
MVWSVGALADSPQEMKTCRALRHLGGLWIEAGIDKWMSIRAV